MSVTTPGEAPTLEALKTLVIELAHLPLSPGDLAEGDALLGERIGLDSIALFDVIEGVQDRFGVRFEEEDLTEQAFSSLGELARLIDRRAAQPGG